MKEEEAITGKAFIVGECTPRIPSQAPRVVLNAVVIFSALSSFAAAWGLIQDAVHQR